MDGGDMAIFINANSVRLAEFGGLFMSRYLEV
jgi:hypothetical protein